MSNLTLYPIMAAVLAISAPGPAPAGFDPWMQNLFYLGGSFAFVLFIWNEGKKAFGRKPPLEDDLQRYSATVDKLQQDLAKLPDEQKWQKLSDSLSSFATVPQLAAMEVTFHRELKNVDAYSHSIVHDIIGKEWASRFLRLETDSRERGERLAAVEAHIEIQTQRITSLENKVGQEADRVIDKMWEIVGGRKRS
jgi:hypothetical protein